MSVKCGNHQGQTVHHETVADVRNCYLVKKDWWSESGSISDVEARRAAATTPTFQAPAPAETSGIMAQLKRAHANNPRVTQAAVPEVMRKFRPATQKQTDFLKSLLDGREISEQIRPYADMIRADLGHGQPGDLDYRPMVIGIGEASKAIAMLAQLPKRQATTRQTAPIAVTQDGIYRNPATGEIFKAQFNKAQGDGRRLYAKQLVVDGKLSIALEGAKDQYADATFTWTYRAGLISQIRPEWKLTAAEAEKFGRLYGRCFRCHRELTLEESIRRSMGRICAGKEGW